MTVLDVIQRSSEFLARKGVESPRLQVELLLAHILQLPRLKLYLNFDRQLTEDQTIRVRELVCRRGDREPLQHILGSTSFCGFELVVNRDVLVPRPETELLAERAWRLLESLENPKVLDVGTGSGCLAITLAIKSPTAQIHATDLSASAIDVARANAVRHAVTSRITFHESDLFSALPAEQFDLIVSNPPYIPTNIVKALEPEVRDHDPRAALDGGPDGLTFYRRLAVESPPHLAEGGTLLAEFGDDQHGAVAAIFSEHGWTVEEIVQDLAMKPRIIIARRPNY
jgi:release factor glutamine methyltransferase